MTLVGREAADRRHPLARDVREPRLNPCPTDAFDPLVIGRLRLPLLASIAACLPSCGGAGAAAAPGSLREALASFLLPHGAPAVITRVTFDTHRSEPTVVADPEQIRRVLEFVLDVPFDASVDPGVKWVVAGSCCLTRSDGAETCLQVMVVGDHWAFEADHRYYSGPRSIEAWWKAALASGR